MWFESTVLKLFDILWCHVWMKSLTDVFCVMTVWFQKGYRNMFMMASPASLRCIASSGCVLHLCFVIVLVLVIVLGLCNQSRKKTRQEWRKKREKRNRKNKRKSNERKDTDSEKARVTNKLRAAQRKPGWRFTVGFQCSCCLTLQFLFSFPLRL